MLKDKLVALRSRLAGVSRRPLLIVETSCHGGYCYFLFMEGHVFVSLCASGMLMVVVVSAALGVEI